MNPANITLQYATNYFRDALFNFYGVSELDQILQITFLHYFNLNRIDLTLKNDIQFHQTDFDKILRVINELKQNKPLAQIIGEWEFYGISLKINEHTLIPRPETEELVQLIIKDIKGPISILDIGTGSGCIALALKKNIPEALVSAYDISEEALKIASSNASQNNLKVIFNKVDILNWEKQDEKYDVIVSNPPYITVEEKVLMAENVLGFEPHLALFVEDEKPLVFYNAIVNFALNNLNEKGRLYFEINEKYGSEVKELLINKKFKKVNIVKDINGKDRIVSCILD